jgi:predicted aspartyl protease
MKRLSNVIETEKKGEIQLISDCIISRGNEKRNILGDLIKVKALWDTGASFCAISPVTAKKLSLESLGKESIINKDGRFKSNIYIINLHFAENWIEPVAVFESDCETNQLLIGMDLISRGNFMIKKTGSKLEFSFEVNY